MPAPANAPVPPAPSSLKPERTSLFAAEAGGDTAAAREAAVEAAVQRGLLERILIDSPRAGIAQVVILSCVAVMLWRAVSPELLVTWSGVLVLCFVTREVARRRVMAAVPPLSFDVAMRRFRLILAMTGLVWGIGAATIMPGIPFHKTALLLVVLSGLTAGSVNSGSGA